MIEFFEGREFSILRAIFANFIFFLSALLIGAGLFSSLKLRRRFSLAMIWTILGVDILSLLALLLGNSFDRKLPVFCFLIILFFALKARFRFCEIRNFFPFGLLKFHFDFSIAPILICMIMIMGRSLCPPTAWDELTYQLAVPLRWLKSSYGNEIFLDNPYSGFPSLALFTFRTLIASGGLLAPRVCVLVLFLLSALSLHQIVSVWVNKIARFAVNAAFCFSFAVLMSASSAYAEIFILANFAGAVLLLQEREYMAQQGEFIQMALISGIFAGAAASVKLTGLIMLPTILILMLSSQLPNWRNPLCGAIFCISGIIFAALFYIRPFLVTGNVFFPYFAWLFSDDEAIIEMSRYHHAIGSEKYGLGGLSGFFTTPLLLALGEGPFDGLIGLQFIPLFLLACFEFLRVIHSGKISSFFSFRAQLFIVTLIVYIFWFFTSQQARFFIPAIFAICVISANLISAKPLTKKISIFILILSIISIPKKFVSDCWISWQTILGKHRKIDYVFSATGDGYLQACDFIRNNCGSIKKLLLFFEHRGAYITTDYLIATPFFQHVYFTPPESCTEKDIETAIRKENTTHILVGLSLNDPDRLPKYLERSAKIAKCIATLEKNGLIQRVYENETFIIYNAILNKR